VLVGSIETLISDVCKALYEEADFSKLSSLAAKDIFSW
jgi:hypothetical protein